MFAKWLAAAAIVFALPGCATPPSQAAKTPSAAAWAEACEDFDEWDKPGPPYRIHGNTYYVGTCGISSILVVSPEGHTLIDSGTEAGAEIVLDNIRALGFDPADVGILLMSHEHFDHIGGMARLQAATGARLVTSPRAAEAMRTGIAVADDPQAGLHPPFAPMADIVTIEDGGEILSGDHEFRAIFTPGHTPGALTWTWRDCDDAGCRSIVYVDSLNPIGRDDYRFSGHPAYLAAFRAGLDKVEALDCDIVLAPHPSAANMRQRATGEAPLIDRNGCKAYVAIARERLEQRLAKERDGE